MKPLESNKYFAQRDVLLLAVLSFFVVLLLIGYEAYQKSKITMQSAPVEAPPVIIDKPDMSIFDKLKTMTE